MNQIHGSPNDQSLNQVRVGIWGGTKNTSPLGIIKQLFLMRKYITMLLLTTNSSTNSTYNQKKTCFFSKSEPRNIKVAAPESAHLLIKARVCPQNCRIFQYALFLSPQVCNLLVQRPKLHRSPTLESNFWTPGDAWQWQVGTNFFLFCYGQISGRWRVLHCGIILFATPGVNETCTFQSAHPTLLPKT